MILRGAIFLAGVAITAFGPTLARAEILIATAGPMTGQYAWFGDQYARGAEMALSVLAYNLTRVMNIIDIRPLIQAMGT